MNKSSLLCLLQLSNSSLPVGAYSYSESLEQLIESNLITEDNSLKQWLLNELKYGSIRIDTAIMTRAYQAFLEQDKDKLIYWNNWLSASREAIELRQQSWQMGKSLIRLVRALEPSNQAIIDSISAIRDPCNYGIIFGIVSANWQISLEDTVLAYLHSWVNNLINVGVKLIPLGQTTGQKTLLALNHNLIDIAQEILALDDDNLKLEFLELYQLDYDSVLIII